MGRLLVIAILCLKAELLTSCNKSYDPAPTPKSTQPPVTESVPTTKVIIQDGYTLNFKNNDPAFNVITRESMIKVFYTVYPKLAKRFNANAVREVTFFIDTSYQGAAFASGNTVTYSAAWMRDHPADTDIVTHEVMHLVQAYPGGAGPGWLTEGIADYARYKFGVNNAAGGWSLPEFSLSQSYTNSYRVTARFLAWLEHHAKSTIVDELDIAMRSKTYTADTWSQLTGKTIDELWQSYSQNPAL